MKYKCAARALVGALVVSCLAGAPLLMGGCARDSGPTIIENVDESVESTAALTPLERGKLRRGVLSHTRDFVSAWKDSDEPALKALLPKAVLKLFTDVWADYAEQGLSVRHVHDVSTLDVTEFNKTATQATVSYVFEDTSYLVDKDGTKVRGLSPIETSLTITLERETGGDEWKIVRMFMKEAGYR